MPSASFICATDGLNNHGGHGEHGGAKENWMLPSAAHAEKRVVGQSDLERFTGSRLLTLPHFPVLPVPPVVQFSYAKPNRAGSAASAKSNFFHRGTFTRLRKTS